MTEPHAGRYSARVREYFATPAHAGDLAARYPRLAAGSASESGSGCRVALVAGIDGGVLREVRFRVFGCPHLVAAAEAWCRRVEGRPADDPRAPSARELLPLLDVPVEKTGRILLLEDAWAALERDSRREPMAANGDQDY